MSAQIEPIRPVFSGHESFPFRYGWLAKGMGAIAADPSSLGRIDSMVDLGVGKNMLASIRHWLVVLGLAEKAADGGGVAGGLVPTDLGRQLFLEPAWDPYLEFEGTLWLLHHTLATGGATTWWWVFNRPTTTTFKRENLVSEIERYANTQGWRVSSATLKRDVDCFMRTYLPPSRSMSSPKTLISRCSTSGRSLYGCRRLKRFKAKYTRRSSRRSVAAALR